MTAQPPRATQSSRARRALSALGALLVLLPHELSAQSGARAIVPVAPILFAPAEGERLNCRRQRADEQRDVSYPGRGVFEFAREGSLRIRWRVVLIESQRTITIALERNYVPRDVVVDAGRGAGTTAAHESVRVRFLPGGEVQNGFRAVTGDGRSPPVTSPLDSADGGRIYALAREIAFRCDRGLMDAMPIGSVQGQIPPG
ncbi:MAG: hypothetical protein C0503_02635 [Gemmatimonas sp.]|nr:hypothetical protein [Gemmatimonas sp.]